MRPFLIGLARFIVAGCLLWVVAWLCFAIVAALTLIVLLGEPDSVRELGAQGLDDGIAEALFFCCGLGLLGLIPWAWGVEEQPVDDGISGQHARARPIVGAKSEV